MEASLTCAVCLSLLEEPVTLPLCSHNFCRGCVLECLASAEAARLQQLQRSPGQARLGRGAPGPGPGPSCARVPCPLCRKLCLLPRGGVAALPVNTTLAEVVKLYRAGAAGAATAGEAALGPKPGSDLLSVQAFGGSCQKHPSRPVQLYCRMCRQAGCGQCVSEEHQGIFHSVNLIDTVYQEEKLTFFSTLKQMRIINEKLVNEISKQPNDADVMLKNEVEIIELKFGEIFKTLEAKKQQLLEDVENQRGKKEKEFQIWKKMKETHKKTIENFLKDCEKLVHECDPQCFLEVACGLNTRMKTQLDVMNIASSWEKPPVYVPKKIDIKSVVNEILALELTPVDAGMVQELPYEGNESSTLFKDTLKQWQDQKNIPNTFLPVAGQDEADGRRIPTRFMSISEMSAFQNMSHEELRYKYYMELQKLTNVFKTQNFPANKKYKFVTAEASKDKSSGTSFISSPTKANKTDKIKMGTLQRGGGFDKRNCSGSSAHVIPSTSRIFSETNGDLKLFHEGSGQEVSGPALSETSPDLLIKEKWPRQASAGTVSKEMNSSSGALLDLKPSAATSESVDVSAERPSGVPFTFSASNNSVPRSSKDRGTFSFKKQDKRCAFPQFYLGKCDKVDKTNSQDKYGPETKNIVCDASTSPNLVSSESEKPHILFPFSNSERDWSAESEASNSCKVLPSSSFCSQSEKPSDKKTLSHMREKAPCAKEPGGYGTQKPSVLGGQKLHTSESSVTVACGTSETNTGAGVNDVSKTPLLTSNCAFSFKSNFPLPSPVFSFGGILRNTSDLLTSSMFFSGNRTEKMDKEKMKTPDKTLLNLGKPVTSECAEPASLQNHPKCEGSCLSMNSSENTESAESLGDGNAPCQPLCSGVCPVEDENASSTQLTAATQQQKKVKDEETVAANNCVCPRKEDEPEPVQLQSTACSVPGTCSDPSFGGSVLAISETGEMLRDSTSDT
ncbi:uncharacterized protein LOC121348398 isoform X1 [Onychostruthus taczanowskii]|uniref:uncharacterized protein LOC121348398 isoform X1 n=1 Tax=Onychostruthus taczanowskii TaxID=356909 RepID=UPI001B80A647|nr:uncharacterized protein LOC121348398 isoform X1 [Onychostruthus taczanowskii]